MSTLKDRILEIQKKMDWSDAKMAAAAGVSRSAVAQWAGKGSKIIHTISDVEAVLNIERETGYSALWIAKGKGPKTAAGRVSADFWPFSIVCEEKIRALDRDELNRLEGAMVVAARYIDLNIKKDG